MSECCESDHEIPYKHRCPVNGKEYPAVGVRTVLHHLSTPWQKALTSASYYFCSDEHCDVVYFGQDDSVITKAELRTAVGAKENTPDRMLCYCFGVSYAMAKKDRMIVDFVKNKTKHALCSCETSNPSGRCCLKDFP